MLKTIRQASVRPNYKVRLRYSDGKTVVVDFSPLIKKGGVFKALSNPKVFARVSIGDRGRFIEWPGHIDFCADALRHKGSPVLA